MSKGLLQKGLKYNIRAKKENWIQTLALEAETASHNYQPMKETFTES